jgi:hypothetical protein
MATREVTFAVQNGVLTRLVRLADGREYKHACPQDAFEAVAWYVQKHLGRRLSANALWRRMPGLRFTQIQVALAFLHDRGCVGRTGRWAIASSETVYEDAMGAFYHLAEVGT